MGERGGRRAFTAPLIAVFRILYTAKRVALAGEKAGVRILGMQYSGDFNEGKFLSFSQPTETFSCVSEEIPRY